MLLFIKYLHTYLILLKIVFVKNKNSIDSLVLESSFSSVTHDLAEKIVVSRVLEIVASVAIFEVVSDVDIFLKSDRNRIIRIILLKNVILLYITLNVDVTCNDAG